MPVDLIQTQFLVLEKRPYRESAYLLYGLSPDCGRLSLVAHGGQKSDAGIDVFREFDLEFSESRDSSLHTAKNLELLQDFSLVSERLSSYKLLGRISAFLLKNVPENLPQPYLYDTMLWIMRQLSAEKIEEHFWTMEQCSVLVKVVYLYENGLLPMPEDEARAAFLENLVSSGIEGLKLPDKGTDFWHRLNLWLNSVLDFHHLER